LVNNMATFCDILGNMGINQRLRERREKAGLTLGQVGEYEGLGKQYLSKLELGVNDPPTWDLLARLARRYHTSTDYLLGLTDDPAATDQPLRGNRPPEIVLSGELGEVMGSLGRDEQTALIEIGRILSRISAQNRERILGQFFLRMMQDFEDALGEKAAEDLYSAIDLAADGDDSALSSWFMRYVGTPKDGLPNSRQQ
jgi:transcriptional regulator with XRE-family HTH domain